MALPIFEAVVCMQDKICLSHTKEVIEEQLKLSACKTGFASPIPW